MNEDNNLRVTLQEFRMLAAERQKWKATRLANDGATLSYLIAEAQRDNVPQAMIDEMARSYVALAQKVAKPKRHRRWLFGRHRGGPPEGSGDEPRHQQLELKAPFELPPPRGDHED